jgi:hypothetical protein
LGRNVICIENDYHSNRHRTGTGTETNFGRNSATTRGSPAKSRRHETKRSHKYMNTTRRIHLNPQSKGNLGKSFEAEFRTAWLDKLGVPWNGSDLDDRHHTFAYRHREAVRSYHLGNEQESKTALLSLFRRVLKDSAPIHVIDTRAHPMWSQCRPCTPTGNQRGPPSTSFSRAERLRPSGVRLRSARYARLRSASPRRGEAGWRKDNLQKAKYTDKTFTAR